MTNILHDFAELAIKYSLHYCISRDLFCSQVVYLTMFAQLCKIVNIYVQIYAEKYLILHKPGSRGMVPLLCNLAFLDLFF